MFSLCQCKYILSSTQKHRVTYTAQTDIHAVPDPINVTKMRKTKPREQKENQTEKSRLERINRNNIWNMSVLCLGRQQEKGVFRFLD